MDEKNKWIRRERERERNWSVCTRAGLVGFSNDKRWLGLGFLVYRELFVRVDYRTFQLLLKYSSALPLRDYCQRLGPDQRIRNYRWVSLKTWWWQSCLSIFNQVNDFISRGNRQPSPTLQHTHAGAPWWWWWWHVLDVIFYSAERKEKIIQAESIGGFQLVVGNRRHNKTNKRTWNSFTFMAFRIFTIGELMSALSDWCPSSLLLCPAISHSAKKKSPKNCSNRDDTRAQSRHNIYWQLTLHVSFFLFLYVV